MCKNPHEAFGLETDFDAIYSAPGMYRWRAFMWACVSSGDEFETGPPDVQTPRDHGIARLGVPASTAPSIAMAESQLSLEDAASPNAGLEKVTDGGR